MTVPTRSYSSPSYRYGFQGQEKDDEIKGPGNSINYKYRMHDPRVGRFFAVDPLAGNFPHNSVYAFSENRVIDGVELEGLEVGWGGWSKDLPPGAADEATRAMSGYFNNYVVDWTVTENFILSGAALSYGESTIFNIRGDKKASGTLKHFGIVIDRFNTNPIRNIKPLFTDHLSGGLVSGIDGDVSNYSGFFVGVSVSGDGIGGNHSGWYSSTGGYVSSSTMSISFIDLIISLGTEMHNVNASINIDFFIDPNNSDSSLEQFDSKVLDFYSDISLGLEKAGIVTDPELKERIDSAVNLIRDKIIELEKSANPPLIDSPIPSKKSKTNLGNDSERL